MRGFEELVREFEAGLLNLLADQAHANNPQQSPHTRDYFYRAPNAVLPALDDLPLLAQPGPP
jgi:hypothetical protein